jgi:hypothetical protein
MTCLPDKLAHCVSSALFLSTGGASLSQKLNGPGRVDETLMISQGNCKHLPTLYKLISHIINLIDNQPFMIQSKVSDKSYCLKN